VTIPAELINGYSDSFDEECQARHKMGAEKYGPVAFLSPDNDLIRMLQEELVDASNYCRYLYIRLSLIHNLMAAREADTPLGQMRDKL
jgi:hypothetical protein